MYLKKLELNGFKSFAKKSEFVFDVPIVAIVGPNGSGKSNVVEAIRFVLGEQSIKSMRGKTGSDLIFKGSKMISKMSRASVTIVFDNKDRVFHIHEGNNSKINVDFDEVVISREVFIDGGNKYMINGNEVRMRDIHELIASVNIGSSGHHIISQGEADRYLNSNIKDRRVLIEEALGLKVYQYRLKESKRKLEKAEANMRESEIMRRELSPHLKFLKRQVAKIEKGKQLRIELTEMYKEYFSKEDYLIRKITSDIESRKDLLKKKFIEVDEFLSQNPNPESKVFLKEEDIIKEKKIFIQDWQKKIETNNRELGKIEGMISLLEKQNSVKEDKNGMYPDFPYKKVKNFFDKILTSLRIIHAENIPYVISEIKDDINEFLKTDKNQNQEEYLSEINELNRKKKVILDATREASSYIDELLLEISNLEETIQSLRDQERESQKKYYEHLAFKKELDGKQEVLKSDINVLNKRIIDRNEEYNEAIVLLSEQEFDYQKTLVEIDSDVNEITQEKSRRDLERIKIRLEDIGGGSGSDTLREYEETLERDRFLENEILDIRETIDSLNSIILDLKQKLNSEFNEGIDKINTQFDKFFKLMFGGGYARLEPISIKKRNKKSDEEGQLEFIEEDSSKKEYGIDIKVSLPRKKVSDLDMLSGGERSLTSIALLFALSQVNPPPFLVLDETDAALDEANSQKYGDMIETLSKFSQLILVTHNRETMSRAHTLFGVTLGRGDASTMLSLRLEDAEKYAK